MKGDFGSLTWVNDKDGKEYVCYANNPNDKRSFEELSEKEQQDCSDVNNLVGTERW